METGKHNTVNRKIAVSFLQHIVHTRSSWTMTNFDWSDSKFGAADASLPH